MYTNLNLQEWAKTVVGRGLVYGLMLCMNISYAAPAANNSNEFVHPFDSQDAQTLQSQQAMNLNSSMMGLTGPFSVGGQYSSLDKFSVNAQYTKKFNQSLAASLLGEYGNDMYRYGATLGAKFFENGFAKISGEQFTQNLPFDFQSGDVDKYIDQYAFGARYQQNFHVPLLRNLNAGAYYSHAASESLDPVLFDFNGQQAMNYRNIAGGRSSGGDIGSVFQISPSTEVSAQLYYDHLRYDVEFTDESEDDTQGLGGGFGLKQLLGQYFSVAGEASVREIYNTYTAELAWLPPMLPGAEITVVGQTVVSQNNTPDNNTIGLQFGYNFGIGGGSYALSNLETANDVGQWTKTPAVYMEQVLAVAEEKVDKLGKNLVTNAAITTVTAIEPASGPLAGSQGVVIKGAQFVEPVTVTFDGVIVENVKVISSQEIMVDAPAHKPGTVAVQVTGDKGVSTITELTQYTYQTSPEITELSSTEGPADGGTLVTIAGKNFTGATAVKFGEVEGLDLTIVNAGEITVKAPAQPEGTQAQVAVVTASGMSEGFDGVIFHYTAARNDSVSKPPKPDVVSVEPTSGSTAGGTAIVIKGVNFDDGQTVHVGNQLYNNNPNQTEFTVNGDGTEIYLTTRATNNPGCVDIKVTASGGGQDTLKDAFCFTAPPTITEVDPTAGPQCGGTEVTITGHNLTDATVKFNNIEVVPTVRTNTMIKVISPKVDSAGIVTVTITTTSGEVSFPYTYTTANCEPPSNLTMSPQIGSRCGGTLATITGENLLGATVTFGGVAATVTSSSDTQIVVEIPPYNGAGNVAVRVTNTSGFADVPDGFRYLAGTCSAPEDLVISPNSGPQCDQNEVTITGENLGGATEVIFTTDQGSESAQITENTDTTITVIVPPYAGVAPATATVTVKTAFGEGSTTYQYLPANCGPPNEDTVEPAASTVCGGQLVVITGENLLDATVYFNGNPGEIVSNTLTQIEVLTPPSTVAGVVGGLIMTNKGESPFDFTYIEAACGGTTTGGGGDDDDGDGEVVAAGLVGALVGAGAAGGAVWVGEDECRIINPTPANGPRKGGQKVTITCRDLVPGKTKVYFGDNPATKVKVINTTTLTAVTPAGETGAVNVSLVTPKGEQMLENQYMYK